MLVWSSGSVGLWVVVVGGGEGEVHLYLDLCLLLCKWVAHGLAH